MTLQYFENAKCESCGEIGAYVDMEDVALCEDCLYSVPSEKSDIQFRLLSKWIDNIPLL